MKTKVHALAGLLSFLCIASFWSATLVSELFLSYEAVAAVKAGIVYVQVLELLAGALNLFLMGLNIRDGMRLTGRLSRCEG